MRNKNEFKGSWTLTKMKLMLKYLMKAKPAYSGLWEPSPQRYN
jgi:hypothetical protein